MAKLTSKNPFSPAGTIGRAPYAMIGFLCSALKIAIDNVVARRVFHREWGVASYWSPIGEAVGIYRLSLGQMAFLATMVAIALPFIWLGTALTLRRLRDTGLPPGLVALFFVPVLNIPFLLLMCVVPGRQREDSARPSTDSFLDRYLPDTESGSAATAAAVCAVLGGLVIYAGTEFLQSYGWGIFIALPFVMGFGSVCLYTRKQRRSLSGSIGVAVLSVGLLSIGLLFVAIEGIVCIVMAAPLALPLAILGAVLAYTSRRSSSTHPVITGMLFAILPGMQWAEKAFGPTPSTHEVKTSIEVEAPPEVVWKGVIGFGSIPPPTEFLFRAGIAYPVRAEIHGTGVGAERRCIFSTGAFVEPIEVWDAPRLLKFSVTSNPPPMEEWTPYTDIDPPHLHGFLVSNGGQFLLTPLPGGRTRLEGTTWYRHGLNPDFYWQWWSDAIIHRIHTRVLRHIKNRAETTSSPL